MNKPLSFQEKAYLVNEQYKSGSNLTARAELHQRFSTAPISWQNWIFAQLEVAPGNHILECGCGPGWLWRNNLRFLPADCHITLTDLSAGMSAEAEAALKDRGTAFRFETADIQNLPFPDSSFDVVIANHMLYHVPDLDRAIAESRRVLKGNGRFFAATNGAGHLRELWEIGHELFAEYADEKFLQNKTPLDRWQLSFSLENGAEHLHHYFTNVTLRFFDDTLIVTEAEPILAYLASSILDGFPDEKWEQMRDFVQRKIDNSGSLVIHKETGLFIAH